MEDSNYFFKTIGLEAYMDPEKTFCESLGRDEMDNLDYSSLAYENKETKMKMKMEENSGKSAETEKDDGCDKQEQVINDEVSQIMAKVQADDFFSSLELQSSAKSSSGVLSLNFQSKPVSGILTRSRSLLSTNSHDSLKGPDTKAESKTKAKKKVEGKSDKSPIKRVKRVNAMKKGIRKNVSKSSGKKARKASETEMRKQTSQNHNQYSTSAKIYENILDDKNKEDDDWVFFQQLSNKKETTEDKLFGTNKQLLGNDLNQGTRRCTPELFSMSPILISDVIREAKDEVDDLLEGEYDEEFLEEMDEFSQAPPRSHTGGKWKPGSQPSRTSPMLWPSQNWESLLYEEGGKLRSETPVESPTAVAGGKWKPIPPPATYTGGKWKPLTPPATHTGGKWKPLTPPATHTGGKWKPLTPPATHTGGKWKPSDLNHRPKKLEQDIDDSENIWKYDGASTSGPPARHTGGKWKPTNLSQCHDRYKDVSAATKPIPNVPADHTHGKWVSGEGKTSFGRSTLDIVANCQSTSGKCLKTSGGVVQYYCSPCNRRLSSKKMYKKHLQSELHLKRVLQENDLEYDSRSIKMYRGLFTQSSRNDRGYGKRIIKKPEVYQDNEMRNVGREKKTLPAVKIKGKKISRKEIIRCQVCKIKIPSYQLGKHLVSYYHTRRSQLADLQQQDLILTNIHAIVKQAPYQCGICKFYCNSHAAFKRHWSLPVHKEVEESVDDHRFWCALCGFECETSRSMELHLDSNSHREVIQAVNKSIPIIIRHKRIFRCEVCFREFRFNRELIRHQERFHPETVEDSSSRYVCRICERRCKSMKSLQKHIIRFHKGQTDVPYFCSICNESFASVDEARDHRNKQVHKYRKSLVEKGNAPVKGLSRSCSYCEKTLDDLEKLKVHLFENHKSLLPKCMKCGKVFALSQEVSRHVKKNECDFAARSATDDSTPSSSFKCEICPFSTNLRSEFLLHGAIHQKKNKDDRKIECPLCESQFTQSALSVHLRTHLKEKIYECSMCSNTFVRKDRYVAHLKLKHFAKADEDTGIQVKITESSGFSPVPEEINANKDVSKKKKVRGKNAEKPESTNELILERRQLCGDAKCKYSAKDANDLEQHSLIHVGPKVYQCPECPYYGKTNTVIKRHYMIHLGEKKFSCPHCPFKGRLKSHLKRHLRLHTGAKPYKCPHCSYTCNILENLRKHVLNTKIHSGKKLYECKFCSFDTNGSKEFKLHLMESHEKDCRVADAIVAAGIYNREEDVSNPANTVLPLKRKSPAEKPSPKSPSKNLKRKIEILTQRFTPIAPKDEKLFSPRPTNRIGNSVEDKRKLLEMELKKLRTQIKPETRKTVPKSYPSPADKVFKVKRTSDDIEETQTVNPTTLTEKGAEVEGSNILEQDGDMMLVIPSMSTCPVEETETKEEEEEEEEEDLTMQPLKLSPSAYVLCDSEIVPQETELYLLENYEV